MVLIRNVFCLKFGQTKEAVATWKQIVEFMREAGMGREHRLLTDLAAGHPEPGGVAGRARHEGAAVPL